MVDGGWWIVVLQLTINSRFHSTFFKINLREEVHYLP